MQTRLLSFLADFERALAIDDPEPDGGLWETSRTVNYHLGLARLVLGVRQGEQCAPRGQIMLQGYQLADGTPCLKASLAWTGADATVVRAIYSKPEVEWAREARKLAAEWMAGAPAPAAAPETEADETRDLVSPLRAAM